MAISSNIVRKVSVRNGYDITIDYTDDTTGVVYRKVFFYKAESVPTDSELTGKVSQIQSNVQDLISSETFNAAHPPMDRFDIEKILREKELLASDEYIEDLKSKDDLLKE